ncbi:MAG: oligosaccharide flippase family protein [Nitrospirae bacterium]|nr:oligosaccharide flippase family protein [Nitrospirota bacterium]
MLITFFVSPIIVHSLGNENYGIWTLIVSITGYFTVLDFGVNTAIVRYISMYMAKGEFKKAKGIYTTAFVFFFIIGISVFMVTAIMGYFFRDYFNIETLSKEYLYFVFFIVGADFAFNFIFTVNQATLFGLQDFLKVNTISISSIVVRSSLTVFFLLYGYSLVALAVIQLLASIFRALFQYLTIRKKYKFFVFNWQMYDRQMLKQIFNYSIYSFLISIALKILFFTDSVVIGKLIKVSEVTFFAIPAMMMDYTEKFIWTISAVMIPVISSHDATGDHEKNREIYIYGSKYSLMLSIPIIFVIYTNGANFISIWMGEEYGMRAEWVLKILTVGYAFYFPQMISHGVLKGISKHKIFAYILIAEAVANLGISVFLAKSLGIEGVALGTAIPLIIVNTIIVPMYTCRVLKLNILSYTMESYIKPLCALAILTVFYHYFNIKTANYLDLFLYTSSVIIFMAVFSFLFIIEKGHRDWAFNGLKSKLSRFV